MALPTSRDRSRRSAAVAPLDRPAWRTSRRHAFRAALGGAPLAESLGILIRNAAPSSDDRPCTFSFTDGAGQELVNVAGSIGAGAERGERAVWSFPIETEAGTLVGTLAIAVSAPQSATPIDHAYGAALARAAALIIAHARRRDRPNGAAELSRTGERHVFLAELSDAFEPSPDTRGAQRSATQLVADAFGADGAFFGELAEDGATLVVRERFTRGPGDAPVPGAAFELGAALAARLHGGEQVSHTGHASDAGRGDPMHAALLALGARALLATPLVRSGRSAFVLVVVATEPRRWRVSEGVDLKEAAERIRAALERTYMEEALRASELHYRTLVDGGTGYAIVLLDEDGLVREWSGEAQRLFGYASDEILGRHLSHLRYAVPNVTDTTLEEARALGRTEREAQRVRKNGERFWASEVLTALYDAETKVLVGFASLTRDLTERRSALDAAQRWRGALERDALRRRLLAAEEEERRRISRELHDESAQYLTALSLGLARLAATTLPGSEAERHARALGGLVDRLESNLHTLATRLRPSVLDDFGLTAAVETHVEDWARRTKIHATAVVRLAGCAIAPPIETVLYRALQEGLTNISRHAAASEVTIVLEHGAGWVSLRVEDDGAGFDLASSTASQGLTGLGLLGMRERVALYSGILLITSTPGAGTVLSVRLPLDIHWSD